ncbi:MAG: hypothetical protein KGJ13_05065 [Patescibacteria group bacterium]|nr:hypothetical protein [Patescibacteria group bacterium]
MNVHAKRFIWYAIGGGLLYYILFEHKKSNLQGIAPRQIRVTHSLDGLMAATDSGPNPVPIKSAPTHLPGDSKDTVPPHGPQMHEASPFGDLRAQDADTSKKTYTKLQQALRDTKGDFSSQIPIIRALNEWKIYHGQGILAQIATSDIARSGRELARRGLVSAPSIVDPTLHVIESDTRYGRTSLSHFRFGKGNMGTGLYKSPSGAVMGSKNPYENTFYDPQSGAYRVLEG